MKKIIIFGAGKIGRSFIGQIFGRSGYETVFVDIQQELVQLLNRENKYRVIIKGPKEEELLIRNVRACHFKEKDILIRELVSADLVAVSVGKSGFINTLEILAAGIKKRYDTHPGHPIDIIIAENMRNAAELMSGKFTELLGQSFPLGEYIGLIETSIGKMVPIMSPADLANDPLQVFAEPYNTLILDKKGFRNPVPDIPWLSPKENIRAWVDRKSFIHNLGHAAAAYLGYLRHPEKVYMYEVLADEALEKQVRLTMEESAEILMKMYPDEFSRDELAEHITDLLARFRNIALKDSIFRVGSDLPRKLARDDRMVTPVMEGFSLNLPVGKILFALVSGFYFRAADEEGNLHPNDQKFYNNFIPEIDHLLERICNFDPVLHKELINIAREYCNQINTEFDPDIKIN